MIKLYGSKASSAGRCYWALEEAGVSYEGQEMDFQKGEMKTDWYLKLNPNGKVPTLDDNGFVLWESMAINRYIAGKYKPELLGNSEQERALVDQWSLWALTAPQPHCEAIMMESWSGRNDEKVIARANEFIAKYMAILDKHLADHEYLVGQTFTLADLNVASVIGYATYVKFDISPYTNIGRWMTHISERPAFQKAH